MQQNILKRRQKERAIQEEVFRREAVKSKTLHKLARQYGRRPTAVGGDRQGFRESSLGAPRSSLPARSQRIGGGPSNTNNWNLLRGGRAALMQSLTRNVLQTGGAAANHDKDQPALGILTDYGQKINRSQKGTDSSLPGTTPSNRASQTNQMN